MRHHCLVRGTFSKIRINSKTYYALAVARLGGPGQDRECAWTTFPREPMRQAECASASVGTSIYKMAAGRVSSFLPAPALLFVCCHVLRPPHLHNSPLSERFLRLLHPRLRDAERAAEKPAFSVSAVEANKAATMAARVVVVRGLHTAPFDG